ncbi:MAG TPA: bifunctional 4-hydroxy-2-oxoglutarate aldolase/2-dehydro-3-deoxy-phosphogluconate aldolase [Chthoniobacterales bacterium]
MSSVLDQLHAARLVPVIALQSADHAAPLADSLLTGGLPVAEVTFRTAAAAESIRIMSEKAGLLVGAGTVLKVDQVKQAVDNGAKFIVSPGFNPKVVGYCVENNIPITPGTANPTDIEMALDFGLEVVKFFPAEAIGGIKTLKAFSAPYGMMRFIPTGGITEANLKDYLSFPKVLACGGSWMVPGDKMAEGKFDEVTALIESAVALAKSIRP